MRAIALYIVCGLILTAVSVSADQAASIKVGATLALSGKFAFIGESEQRGLILGVEQANREAEPGSPMLELIFEDNAADAKSAAHSVHKLLDVDEVDVIFSAFTHITRAIAPIVAAKGKLMIYESSVKDIAAQSPLFFRDYLDMEQDAEVLAKLVAKRGFNRVAYVRDDGEACEVHENEFIRIANAGAKNVISQEEFQSGSPDIKPTLLRAVNSKPEALVICAWRDSSVLVKQLASLGNAKLPVFYVLAPFVPAADTLEMRALYERQHAVSTWYGFIEGEDRAEYRNFRDAYMKKFGEEPRPDAAYAFDDMRALGRAVRACPRKGAVDVACIARELSALEFAGAAGRFFLGASRISMRPTFLMEVRDGKWQPLTN